MTTTKEKEKSAPSSSVSVSVSMLHQRRFWWEDDLAPTCTARASRLETTSVWLDSLVSLVSPEFYSTSLRDHVAGAGAGAGAGASGSGVHMWAHSSAQSDEKKKLAYDKKVAKRMRLDPERLETGSALYMNGHDDTMTKKKTAGRNEIDDVKDDEESDDDEEEEEEEDSEEEEIDGEDSEEEEEDSDSESESESEEESLEARAGKRRWAASDEKKTKKKQVTKKKKKKKKKTARVSVGDEDESDEDDDDDDDDTNAVKHRRSIGGSSIPASTTAPPAMSGGGVGMKMGKTSPAKSYAELQERLRNKIEEFRSKRKEQTKTEQTKQAKEWRQSVQNGRPRGGGGRGGGGSGSAGAGSVPDNKQHGNSGGAGRAANVPEINFNQLDVSDGEGRQGKRHRDGKRKLSKQQMLRLAEARSETLKEKGAESQEGKEMLLKAALARARGDKVFDDPKLLRRSIKRDSKSKERSAKKWEERLAVQREATDHKQAKRVDNLKRRTDAKIERRKQKRLKKLLRPGFEGRKEGFING